MTLTPEKIAKIREAAKKATLGPYYQMGPPWFSECTGVLAGSPDPHVAPVVLETESWAGERDEQVESGRTNLSDPEDDAAYFALLDPATILALCDAAEAGAGATPPSPVGQSRWGGVGAPEKARSEENGTS